MDKYDLKGLASRIPGLIVWGGDADLEWLLEQKVGGAIVFFIGFAALVSVIILVGSGYAFMTSAGDPEKVEKAQKGVTGAIIGLIIVFISRMILDFVVDILTKK